MVIMMIVMVMLVVMRMVKLMVVIWNLSEHQPQMKLPTMRPNM